MAEDGAGSLAGPYLTAAFFCERVIEDKEGVLTAVRMVDRVIQSAIGAGTPEVMPPLVVSLTLLISLKSGDAKGRNDVRIEVEAPTGLRSTIANGLSVFLEGADRGANLILQLQWPAELEGLYWFDILVEGRVTTRVPLRVVYQRQETGGLPSGRLGI